MANQTVLAILNELDKLSSSKLHYRDDVEKFIEIALTKNQLGLLKEISFDAKFLSGVINVIKRRDSSADEEFFMKAHEEYKERLQRVQTLLKDFIAHGTEFYRSIFDEKFMQMNQQSFENLNSLFVDLSFLKLYFNDHRD